MASAKPWRQPWSRRAVVATLFVMWSGAAPAQGNDPRTVGELYSHCADVHAELALGFCYGYLFGVVDALRGAGDSARELGICPPRNYRAELVPRFMAWADEPGRRLERPAGLGVILALREIWPCQAP